MLTALLPTLVIAASPATADISSTGANGIGASKWESRLTSSNARGYVGARQAFDNGTSGPGVCSVVNLRTLHGQNNRSICPSGVSSNYAFRSETFFTSKPSQTWKFRIAPDAGRGGGISVNNLIFAQTTAGWYDPSLTNPNAYAEFTFTSLPNTYTINSVVVYGSEDCCDGTTAAQVMLPGTNFWSTLAASPDVRIVGVNEGGTRNYTLSTPPCSIRSFAGSTAISGLATVSAPVGPRADVGLGVVTATCSRFDDIGSYSTVTGSYVLADVTAPAIPFLTSRLVEQTSAQGAPVTFTLPAATDALDGARPLSCDATSGQVFPPGATTVSCSATDIAGNVATRMFSVTVRDTIAPTLIGTPAAGQSPQGGWYRADVPVTWTATDAGSGVAVQPAETVITGEGADLTSSQTATDRAGNRGTGTSAAVNIDRTAPVTDAREPDGYQQSYVLRFTGYDNLSGIDKTFVSVDGGEFLVQDELSFSTEGTHEVAYYSVDVAGNREDTQSLTVRIDQTAPSVTAAPDRDPNVHGWYDAPVTVSFTCADDQGQVDSSGVVFCAEPAVVDTDGSQVVSGATRDAAGNRNQAELLVNLDRGNPLLTAQMPAPNSAGWYSRVELPTVSCSDELSGIQECSSSPLTGPDTRNGQASAQAVDRAGNSTTQSFTGLQLDRTKPSLAATFDGSATRPLGWLGAPVTVSAACSDNLSGVRSCSEPVVLGEGEDQSVLLESTDVADNSSQLLVSDFDIDLSAPSIQASIAGEQVGGFYTGPVTVTFTCQDALSGLDSCTAPVTLSTAGAHGPVVGTATDRAGNTLNTSVEGIVIDLAAPQITAAASHDAGPSGWYTEPVTVSFTCADDVSGVTECPAPEELSNDGEIMLSRSVNDGAGRRGEGTFGPYRLDQVAPSLTGAPTSAPNEAGWYARPVTISWVASDETSGIAEQPQEQLIDGQGRGLSVTTTVADVAGNSTTQSSPPVDVDLTAPATTVLAPSDWQRETVELTLDASDDLSGVADTVFSVDGGAQQQGGTVALSEQGVHEIEFFSTDVAGNVEDVQHVTVKIDRQAPTIVGARNPLANESGWNSTPVTVSFSCTDAGGSELASCSAPTTVQQDTAGQDVTGNAVDGAGNTASETVVVKLDQVSPTITASAPGANEAGWNRSPVAIEFDCDDNAGGSGVRACTPDTVVDSDTDADGRTVDGQVTDVAGNTGDVRSRVIRLDQGLPTISGAVTAPAGGSNGWHIRPVTVGFACTDANSGVARCQDDRVLASDGADLSVSGSAVDVAGNQAMTLVDGIDLDMTPPTITAVASGKRGSGGWFTGPVTVTFTCADETSGVASCPQPVTLSAPGADQSASGEVVDVAGHTATVTLADLHIDTAAPSISAAVSPTANSAGWNNTYVTVSFTCTDVLSGVASCPEPVVVEQGAAQSVVGTVTDRAGLTSSTATVVNVDLTAPSVAFTGVATVYTVDQLVSIGCVASDALSGLSSSTCPQLSGEAGSLAGHTLSASATDVAGNSATASAVVTVSATFDSLSALTARYAGSAAASLNAKLKAAKSASLKGNAQAKAGQLGAFVNELDAQTGKALTEAQAATLRKWVATL